MRGTPQLVGWHHACPKQPLFSSCVDWLQKTLAIQGVSRTTFPWQTDWNDLIWIHCASPTNDDQQVINLMPLARTLSSNCHCMPAIKSRQKERTIRTRINYQPHWWSWIESLKRVKMFHKKNINIDCFICLSIYVIRPAHAPIRPIRPHGKWMSFGFSGQVDSSNTSLLHTQIIRWKAEASLLLINLLTFWRFRAWSQLKLSAKLAHVYWLQIFISLTFNDLQSLWFCTEIVTKYNKLWRVNASMLLCPCMDKNSI